MDKFPQELKQIDNWLLAGPDRNKKLKAPYTIKNGAPAMAKWKEEGAAILLQYGKAVLAAQTFKYGLGILLRETDGYTVIDFDIKDARNEPDPAKHTSPERIANIHAIIAWLDSYTEYSRSGVGFHVIVRGSIGRGMRHSDTEIYSQDRFIVCTGNVFLDRPIEDRSEQLGQIVASFPRKKLDNGAELVETEQTESDEDVMNSLWNAANGAKFQRLWNGNFGPEDTLQSLGLRKAGDKDALEFDGSSVDHSVVQSLAWRTQCNEQVRRLFSMSALSMRKWQPETAQNKYKHWGRDGVFSPRHVDMCLTRLRPMLQREQEQRQSEIAQVTFDIEAIQKALLIKKEVPLLPVTIEALEECFHGGALDTTSFESPSLHWPPGLVGQLAKYIYGMSPKPVMEVAITGALGLMGGICGRTFQLAHTGTNIFLVLVAKSAIGKDAMHKGISDILYQMKEDCPDIAKFVQADEFASGQALMKSFRDWPSFLKPMDEFGNILQAISMGKMDAHASFIKKQYTVLFQKSGIKEAYGGAQHSDKINNTEGVYGAAFSMIGDTQPSSFYEALNPQMIADGFISRFLIIEYTGDRVATNFEAEENMQRGLSDQIRESLKAVVDIAVQGIHKNATISVHKTDGAKALLRRFDELADRVIIAQGENEPNRQRWNRSKEYIERVAALLAIPDNAVQPRVDISHVEWAMNLVMRNIIMFDKRKAAGDIGTDDATRDDKLKGLIVEYLKGNCADETYSITAEMRAQMVFTKKYLSIRGKRLACFTSFRGGAGMAVDMAIKTAIDYGDISPISEKDAKETFGYRGALYRVNSQFLTG